MSGFDPNSIRAAAAEAANRETAFPAKERAEYVRAMVKRAEVYKKDGYTLEQIKERLPEFGRDYPNLLEMVVSDEPYHKQTLTTMLAMLDRMGEGSLSQHQASVIVGQRLVQTFVKPQIQPNSN